MEDEDDSPVYYRCMLYIPANTFADRIGVAYEIGYGIGTANTDWRIGNRRIAVRMFSSGLVWETQDSGVGWENESVHGTVRIERAFSSALHFQFRTLG